MIAESPVFACTAGATAARVQVRRLKRDENEHAKSLVCAEGGAVSPPDAGPGWDEVGGFPHVSRRPPP
jgi:hypothetical protein